MEHLRDDLAAKVLLAKTPKEAKLIASEVKVPGSWWDDARYDIMKNVLIEKISSSKEFRDALLSSGDEILVEALADPYWGCGLPYHIAITTNPDHYTGSNKLGLLLMELRSEMKKDPTMHAYQNPQIEVSTTATPLNATRGRSMKKRGSTFRTSSAPSCSKSMKTSTTPLIKEVFMRQSVKRLRRDPSTSPKHTYPYTSDDITTLDTKTDDVTQVESSHVSENNDVVDNR